MLGKPIRTNIQTYRQLLLATFGAASKVHELSPLTTLRGSSGELNETLSSSLPLSPSTFSERNRAGKRLKFATCLAADEIPAVPTPSDVEGLSPGRSSSLQGPRRDRASRCCHPIQIALGVVHQHLGTSDRKQKQKVKGKSFRFAFIACRYRIVLGIQHMTNQTSCNN